MKTKRLTKGKAILAFVLMLILASGFYLLGEKAYADEGGTVTVKVGNVVGDNVGSLPAGTTFTYKVYKVGDYDRSTDGTVVYKLDPDLGEASGVAQFVSQPSSFDPEQDDWAKTWVAQANTLATYINSLDDKPDVVGNPYTVTLTKEGTEEGAASFDVNLPTNGLYLLFGEPVQVGDYLWTPQPVFLSALNGSERNFDYSNSVAKKMISRKVVFNHNVAKNWIGDEDISDYVRPSKIAVKIMYGTTLVDTVILERDKGYTFSWKHKKLEEHATQITYYPEGDTTGRVIPVKSTDAGWSVVELREADAAGTEAEAEAPLLRYYTTEYEPLSVDDATESLTIKNTFTCKYLKLRKSIDGFDGNGQNMTFSFKVEGLNSSGTVIYTNHVGVSFTQEDGLTKEVVLNYIPGAVESIRVSEEYSGNYNPVGDIEISELYEEKDSPKAADNADAAGTDDETATAETTEKKVVGWEAEANNEHGNHGPKGGIVNRYNHGEDPVKDPGSDPDAPAPVVPDSPR